jgi:hypothetical protein
MFFTEIVISSILVLAIGRATLPASVLDRLATIAGVFGSVCLSGCLLDIPLIDKQLLAICGGCGMAALAALTNKLPAYKNFEGPK